MHAIEDEVEAREREVVSWRFDELVRAGYSENEALDLALCAAVDLHVACDLLRRGCPSDLAVRIVT